MFINWSEEGILLIDAHMAMQFTIVMLKVKILLDIIWISRCQVLKLLQKC